MNGLKLYRAGQKALIYNVSPKFKKISITYPEGNVINARFLISEQLTEEELKLISNFETKMRCYIPELEKVNIEVLLFNDDIPFLEFALLAFDDLFS